MAFFLALRRFIRRKQQNINPASTAVTPASANAMPSFKVREYDRGKFKLRGASGGCAVVVVVMWTGGQGVAGAEAEVEAEVSAGGM